MKLSKIVAFSVVVVCVSFSDGAFACLPCEKWKCNRVFCTEPEEIILDACGCCEECQKKVLEKGDQCRGQWTSRIDDCDEGLACTPRINAYEWNCEEMLIL
ncbi:hypothetical protein JTB14_028691 [Gonioctena quinquepunctata]|nr:hypothetical protein JTB14_028691 [Gonioctena quinquepunctata]